MRNKGQVFAETQVVKNRLTKANTKRVGNQAFYNDIQFNSHTSSEF